MIFIELETEGLMLKKQYTYLVAGTKNCISIKVKLDWHWQGLEVFAVCYRDNKEYPYAITNGECLIADMAVISTSGEFKLKLLGSTADGNVVMTTNIVTIYINDNKFSGAEGGILEYPTSDYLAEVLSGSKKQADRAQGYAEQAGQIKADTQSIADTAAGNLDKIVQARGYDDVFTCISYVDSTDEIFKREANIVLAWRDKVWRLCYDVLADVNAGRRAVPSESELLAMLPKLEW